MKKPSSNLLSFLVGILMLIVAGCAQETIEPTIVNNHIVTIKSVKPTGAVSQNVEIFLFEDSTKDAKLLSPPGATTGPTGILNLPVAIPTFGHSYSLYARKFDASGTLLTYSRTFYPLTLKCVDTTLILVIPEPDTSVIRDTLCGQDEARTLVFFACADSSVTLNYQLSNCSGNTVTVNGPADPAFSFTPVPNNGTLQAPGGITQLAITYNGAAHTTDATSQIVITSVNGRKMTLTLIGHIRHDCAASTQVLQCGVNSQNDSLKFGTVCQNLVAGPRCVPFQNTSNAPVTITLPAAPSPYSYSAVDDNGRAITSSSFILDPGKSITICVSFNAPAQVGSFDTLLTFPFQCQGQNATFKIPLSARDTICDNCLCTDFIHDPLLLNTNVRVSKDTTITSEYFVNTLDCDVTVSNAKLLLAPSDWTLVSFAPALPAVVHPGGSLKFKFMLKPSMAFLSDNEIWFSIKTTKGTTCMGIKQLGGIGCNDACVLFSMPNAFRPSPAPSGPDTLFLTQGGNKIFVSLPNAVSVSDEECIKIHYPDTACSAKSLVVTSPKSSLFRVITTPSPLVIAPGSDALVCVEFTAPDLAQVRKDFTKPGLELKYTDFISIIDGAGCKRDIPLKAVVDTLPGCTDFTLAIYDAVTAKQLIAYHQVFEYSDQKIITPAPNPTAPTTGDIYITTNTSSPDLNMVNASATRGLFLWKNAPFQDVCANKQVVTQSLQTLLAAGALPLSSTITGIGKDDIIVVALGGNAFSVLLVNGVSDGANFNDLITHVAFRVLYPVFN